jgi:hypothetical protein
MRTIQWQRIDRDERRVSTRAFTNPFNAAQWDWDCINRRLPVSALPMRGERGEAPNDRRLAHTVGYRTILVAYDLDGPNGFP